MLKLYLYCLVIRKCTSIDEIGTASHVNQDHYPIISISFSLLPSLFSPFTCSLLLFFLPFNVLPSFPVYSSFALLFPLLTPLILSSPFPCPSLSSAYSLFPLADSWWPQCTHPHPFSSSWLSGWMNNFLQQDSIFQNNALTTQVQWFTKTAKLLSFRACLRHCLEARLVTCSSAVWFMLKVKATTVS